MSEFSPSQHQPEIDRDGGLYDQAVAEDYDRFVQAGKQRLWDRMHRDDHLEEAYADNALFDARVNQDAAYATYEDNIRVTQEREDAELHELQKKLRKEKTKRGLGRVAAGVSMIPGVAFISDLAQEGMVTSKNNRRRRTQYKQSNGTLFGNKKKGYDSALGKRFKDSTSRYTGGKDNDLIIKNLQTLIEENERRRQ